MSYNLTYICLGGDGYLSEVKERTPSASWSWGGISENSKENMRLRGHRLSQFGAAPFVTSKVLS